MEESLQILFWGMQKQVEDDVGSEEPEVPFFLYWAKSV